jgi:hypothetical protein
LATPLTSWFGLSKWRFKIQYRLWNCELTFVSNTWLGYNEWAISKREWNERFKGPRVPKKTQFTHERVKYNVFFCSTSPLKAPNRLKPLKLAWRFVLTSCDIGDIRSHRRKFSNSDSVEQKKRLKYPLLFKISINMVKNWNFFHK